MCQEEMTRLLSYGNEGFIFCINLIFIIMNIESIGTWSGEVYKALENTDTRMLGLKGIKKATKLKKDELMAALGWLGREGKITITENDEDIIVALV